MAITKPAKKSVENFISSAPDALAETAAVSKPNYVRKGKKLQITLTIAQPLLEEVDALAHELGLSRASVINLAIHQGMLHGINVSGGRNS